MPDGAILNDPRFDLSCLGTLHLDARMYRVRATSTPSRVNSGQDRRETDLKYLAGRRPPDHEMILSLQRSAGNAAVVALLRSGGKGPILLEQRQPFRPTALLIQRCGNHTCPPDRCGMGETEHADVAPSIRHWGADLGEQGSILGVSRQVVSPGMPGGLDPCDGLLQEIINLLDEVAKRYNDALDDEHELYRYHRTKQDAHPEWGSWEGHKDRYKYDRERLRQKIAEWEADDRCRGHRLTDEQREAFKEAEEFREKQFPERPARSLRSSNEQTEDQGESIWEKLRRYLPEVVVGALMAIGAVAVAATIVACFTSGACEVAAAVAGLSFVLAAAVRAALRGAGVRDTSA